MGGEGRVEKAVCGFGEWLDELYFNVFNVGIVDENSNLSPNIEEFIGLSL